MACRVKVRIERGNRDVETVALVNSGFETDSPDIAIPISTAKELGLWPPSSASSTILDTGGGEVTNPYYVDAANLKLILGDREVESIRVNVIVNPHIDEVVISDYVASELGIVLLDIRRGLWRLSDDPPNKVRHTFSP